MATVRSHPTPSGRNPRRRWLWCAGLLVLALAATAAVAHASATGTTAAASDPTAGPSAHGRGVHSDPFVPVLLEMGLVVGAAMFGRWAAVRVGQPSVLGELLLGVAAGNVGYWLGQPLFVMVMHLDSAQQIFQKVWNDGVAVREAATDAFTAAQLAPGGVGDQLVRIFSGGSGAELVVLATALWLFSNLGVILLLFMVGLESNVRDMLAVGPRSLVVAVVGVVVPFVLGLASAAALLPGEPRTVHVFLAATLCATSVGITARVFKDLDRIQTTEARIILGAAVIDDILGLVILAVVVGMVASGGVHLAEIARISALSVVFLGGVLLLGDRLVRVTVRLISELDRERARLLLPLLLAFGFSFLASQIGLASIVGAFAAGLILEEHFFGERDALDLTVEELVSPLEAIFAPVFFVLMGMQVNLSTLRDPATLWLGSAFVVAAVVGKLVAGLPAGPGADRLTVGIGMIPRGEVGLIFASIGKSLGVVTDAVFSAVVLMVIVTTLITPIGLKWSLARRAAAG